MCYKFNRSVEICFVSVVAAFPSDWRAPSSHYLKLVGLPVPTFHTALLNG
jgi:hypothetical protein